MARSAQLPQDIPYEKKDLGRLLETSGVDLMELKFFAETFLQDKKLDFLTAEERIAHGHEGLERMRGVLASRTPAIDLSREDHWRWLVSAVPMLHEHLREVRGLPSLRGRSESNESRALAEFARLLQTYWGYSYRDIVAIATYFDLMEPNFVETIDGKTIKIEEATERLGRLVRRHKEAHPHPKMTVHRG